jgi:hypothetical protein
MKKTTATHCKKPPKHFFNPGKPPLTASKTRAFSGNRVFLPPDAPSVWFPIFGLFRSMEWIVCSGGFFLYDFLGVGGLT